MKIICNSCNVSFEASDDIQSEQVKCPECGEFTAFRVEGSYTDNDLKEIGLDDIELDIPDDERPVRTTKIGIGLYDDEEDDPLRIDLNELDEVGQTGRQGGSEPNTAPEKGVELGLSVSDDGSKSSVNATSNGKEQLVGGQIFVRLLINLTLIVVLFITGAFLLNKYSIYPNNLMFHITNYVPRLNWKKIETVNEVGKWVSSKYGNRYVASGEVVNNSYSSVSFIKLRVNYTLEDSLIYSQEVWAGNSLSDWEVKNKSLSEIKTVILNKNGQIDFKARSGGVVRVMNINVGQGEKTPFVSVFRPNNGDKILGLKFQVEVVDYKVDKEEK